VAATDPISLGLAAVAAATALWAGWHHVRRPVHLDGERWLKVTLATLLRGRIEATGGDADAWASAVRRQVPYHPAGRQPDRKVLHPNAVPDGPLLEGEQALLDDLRKAPDVAARWARLYDGTDEAADALLEDPIELGATYAPAAVLGPGTTWDDVARWAEDPALGTRLAARHPLVWICFHSPPDGRESNVLDALVARWPHTAELHHDSDPREVIEPLVVPGAKLVVAAEGDAVIDALEVLRKNAGLRDQVVAFVAIGAPLMGREGGPEPTTRTVREDWMGRWYSQEHLDTEEVRLTPYLSLQWLDRRVAEPGTTRQPIAWARFPKPQRHGTDVETIESVDLGVLPRPGGPDDDLVAKALLFVVAGWTTQRG
jgi:hypothetical protein